MLLKGRHWLMLWLVVFVVVLLAVATRQTAGFRTARRLRDLRDQRTTLEARRADLERQIRSASSRQVLVPIAEQELGLHLPSDSEFTLLVLPSPPPPR
jgi:cell division protein FtsL